MNIKEDIKKQKEQQEAEYASLPLENRIGLVKMVEDGTFAHVEALIAMLKTNLMIDAINPRVCNKEGIELTQGMGLGYDLIVDTVESMIDSKYDKKTDLGNKFRISLKDRLVKFFKN